MKKLVLLLFSICLIITGCNKDDDDLNNEPQFNDLGLQIDVKPINQDTLAIYNPAAIEVVNATPLTNDFGTEYTINVDATNPEKIKRGNVIVDYANGGRLWIIKDAPESTTGRTSGITAVLGSLDTFFTNAIVEVSTPTNRAKNASSNPDKLESGKFKLYSGSDPLVELNLPTISINEQTVTDGVTLSVDNNTVNVNLSNVQLYSNSSSTFNVTIPEGSLQVNNAVDMRYKYIPLSTNLVGVPVNIGSLQEFNSSIYSTIDTDIKLNIQATTNGAVNLIEPVERELGSYTKVIPVPPYFAASVRVTLKAKLTVTSEAELNITPEIATKNNFEARANYDGLFSIPTFQPEYQNVETTLANSVNGDFNLNQRLEIIPEVEVYAFGLLGPKGELIAYEEFDANASIQNGPLTWDTEIDLGVDYDTSLDISIFHIDDLTTSIVSDLGNVFNYDLFTSPESAEITLGNNQTGETNTQLTTPIEIEVKNSAGETVSGVPVFFETTNGNFTSDYVITDAGGVAVNDWTLGGTTGSQTAIAYVKDGSGNTIEATEVSITATAENATTVNPVNTPNPIDGATDIAVNGNLSFTEGANTPTDATFKVYFDTNTDPTTVFNLDADTNTLNYSNLQEGTVYYWKVETVSNTGDILATSPIWSFTTLTTTGNTEPVFNPTPNDGVSDVSINGSLSFTEGANTPTDATYRLYFDTNTNPTTPFDLGNQTSYNYSSLQENTTYYWYVETLSNSGDVLTTSNTWNFTTENSNNGGDFVGDVVLLTQSDVDDFTVNNYNRIIGELLIGDENNPTSSITDLSGLSSLTEVTDALYIGGNNALTSLDGLHNITYAQYLAVTYCSSLSNLNGLTSINNMNSISIDYNDNLSSLSGLNSLTNVGSYFIQHNPILNNLSGITGNVISEGLQLRNNVSMISLDGLDIFTNIGGLTIEDCPNLSDLSQLISFDLSYFELDNCDSVVDLSSLSTTTSLSFLEISKNDNLSNLIGLNNITTIQGTFRITENPLLNSLQGLSNLSVVESTFEIRDNNSLTSLDGLNNITEASNNGAYFRLKDNQLLNNYCAITNFISSDPFTFDSYYQVSGNAYNPTQQDIIDGNCSQ